jgi:hypothetical protein
MGSDLARVKSPGVSHSAPLDAKGFAACANFVAVDASLEKNDYTTKVAKSTKEEIEV